MARVSVRLRGRASGMGGLEPRRVWGIMEETVKEGEDYRGVAEGCARSAAAVVGEPRT